MIHSYSIQLLVILSHRSELNWVNRGQNNSSGQIAFLSEQTRFESKNGGNRRLQPSATTLPCSKSNYDGSTNTGREELEMPHALSYRQRRVSPYALILQFKTAESTTMPRSAVLQNGLMIIPGQTKETCS